MSWNDEKVSKLKELWGKGKTASQIAEIIGGITRNAVIGKAHRLDLSAKIIRNKNTSQNNNNFSKTLNNSSNIGRKSRRSKFKSLLLSKDFEPAKNLTLEELTDDTCKYMDHDKHPNELDAKFCGRKSVDKFSYCPLHLMIVFQPKGKKDDATEKDEEIPQYVEKKIKSA